MRSQCLKLSFAQFAVWVERNSDLMDWMSRTGRPDSDSQNRTPSSSKELNFWVDRGKGWSMSMLGSRYENGEGVPKDDKRAIEL